MPSAIEVATKTYNSARWGQNRSSTKNKSTNAMRVALRVLSESDIPMSAMKAGIEALKRGRACGGDRDAANVRDVFQAVLGRIAEAP